MHAEIRFSLKKTRLKPTMPLREFYTYISKIYPKINFQICIVIQSYTHNDITLDKNTSSIIVGTGKKHELLKYNYQKQNIMKAKTDYKIKDVTVSTNGRNELYFNVEWEGDKNLEYYELRVWEDGKDYCLEVNAFSDHNQTIVVRDYSFYKIWESKKVNKQTIYVELGVAEYTEKGELLSWKVLADYKPIELNIYYESHIFRKNVIELRGGNDYIVNN